MNYVYLLSGLILLIVTVPDIIKTTFSSKGGGVITNILSRSVWKIFLIISGKNGRSTLLSYAGPVILITILLFWMAGLWSALFLMLLSDPDSVQNSKTTATASPLEKLYYAGFTLSTLGVGDYKASSNLWRIVTGVSAFAGLAFITASITYFVPVLQAVGLQSKLSLYASAMGKTPQHILINSWNGKDFSTFFDNASDICQMLMQHTMHHHSYPVIHYFHNQQPKLAIAPAIVLIAETYHLLKHAVASKVNIDALKMSMIQTALDAYLDMIKRDFLRATSPEQSIPVPDMQRLAMAGIPLQDKESIKLAFEQTTHDRRQLLTLLLEKNGWSWKNVYGEH